MSRPKTLLKDNTLYWVIRLYNSSQVLVDADSTPTVAVRKNGSSVGDAVTVTKRTSTTGIYDCSYNPAGEVEGDQFTLEESATISSQVYENSWSIFVQSIAFDPASDTVNLGAINGNTTSANNLADSASVIVQGTVDTVTNTHTPTTTVFQADDITEATADHYNSRLIIFTSGALIGQATTITDYSAVGGIGQFTVSTMTDAPSNDDTFIIV